jgi:DNA/RNA endonuclease YhcR with UshA esterase domain
MRSSCLYSLLLAPALMSGTSAAGNNSPGGCVSFAEASRYVGTSQCIRGTVAHVETGRNGAKILNFCQESKVCPFTVVVFPSDVKKMGDMRQLEGQQLEIKGTVQDYEGRAQIVLRRASQLGDAAFRLFPPVPTDYDVERAGHGSAGRYSHPKAAKKTSTKKGNATSIEDPEEP